MKLLTFSVSAFLLSLTFALLLGCFGHGSSQAASSAWEPYLVLKAPHATADNALVARLHERHLTWNPWGDAYAVTANTAACPGIGTVAPPSPSDFDYLVTSCGGVLYRLSPCPDSTGPCVIDSLPQGQAILFDTANCSSASPGQDEFVSTAFTTNGVPSISEISVSPGILFRYDPTNLGSSDPSTYLMLAPGGGTESQVNVQSEYVFGQGCKSVAGVTVSAFTLAPNSTTVTQMASAAVAAPVTIGTP